MFDRIRAIVLRVLRVPHEPTPPLGAPGSVRVFRAGRNYYKLRLLTWGLGQLGAAIGIAISVVILHGIFREARAVLEAREQAAAAAPATPAPAPAAVPPASAASPGNEAARSPSPEEKRGRTKQRLRNAEDFKHATGQELGRRTPLWIINTLEILKLLGVAAFIVQLPFSYAAVRLEFDQHWYIVTDRSLRIRSGLMSVLESTMSFANVQQVVVQQGPLQRLLGLADVRVQSAGGGGDRHEKKGRGESLHTGIFHGVENAEEIRDLILERLRIFRQAGLGDPEEGHQHPVRPPAPKPGVVACGGVTPEALDAARELLAEARALRASIG